MSGLPPSTALSHLWHEFMPTEAHLDLFLQGIVMYLWDCIPEDGQVVFVIVFGGLCYLLLFLSKYFARRVDVNNVYPPPKKKRSQEVMLGKRLSLLFSLLVEVMRRWRKRRRRWWLSTASTSRKLSSRRRWDCFDFQCSKNMTVMFQVLLNELFLQGFVLF